MKNLAIDVQSKNSRIVHDCLVALDHSAGGSGRVSQFVPIRKLSEFAAFPSPTRTLPIVPICKFAPMGML